MERVHFQIDGEPVTFIAFYLMEADEQELIRMLE